MCPLGSFEAYKVSRWSPEIFWSFWISWISSIVVQMPSRWTRNSGRNVYSTVKVELFALPPISSNWSLSVTYGCHYCACGIHLPCNIISKFCQMWPPHLEKSVQCSSIPDTIVPIWINQEILFSGVLYYPGSGIFWQRAINLMRFNIGIGICPPVVI